MKTNCSIPASRASSTAYWMTGLSTTGSISLGMALVAGKKRVPMPATGKTALRTGLAADIWFPGVFQGMVLKRPVSWHRGAIIVQFQSFLGNHGQIICDSFDGVAAGRRGAGVARHACDDLGNTGGARRR